MPLPLCGTLGSSRVPLEWSWTEGQFIAAALGLLESAREKGHPLALADVSAGMVAHVQTLLAAEEAGPEPAALAAAVLAVSCSTCGAPAYDVCEGEAWHEARAEEAARHTDEARALMSELEHTRLWLDRGRVRCVAFGPANPAPALARLGVRLPFVRAVLASSPGRWWPPLRSETGRPAPGG